MNGFINDKIMPPMMKFLNTRGVTAIKNGMMYPMPFIIVGSLFLILGQLPYVPLQEYIAKIGLGDIFLAINNASFGIMALFAVFGIAYSWVKDMGYEGAPAGLLGIVLFVLFQPDTVKSVVSITDPTKVSTDYQALAVIDRAWLGGKGMILAIIIGLLVGWGYSWFIKRKITIKMPEQVPENVANSFVALIPVAVIATIGGVIYGIFKIGLHTTVIEAIYTTIQTPLQHVTDSPVGLLIICVLPVFLWWFGVHGSSIIGGVMGALLAANTLDNAKLFKEGDLSLNNGAHIITQAFMDQYLTVTGAGMTLGFCLFMLMRAKSVQLKSIGKLSIFPAFFNINEPILFGTPIVLNPIMAIPFFAAPLVSGVLTYLAIYLHILPPFNGAYVPWTTPPILSGLLVGGWKAMLWQALMIALTVVIYYPFARKYDKVLSEQEAENEAQAKQS
ncbi:MAG: PTS sugar transporter subunit IIC [Streptococcaceae bacterium]|nr:PTS sugar transporter subunit IIC [Streptococcaceae bacterium]MCL2681272.1 PTS sugar transporter subunit IIC [Streptococcaceae bacterium]MCL2858907.1 PTS sugar transporter subunit IIC [Streptococcaceae bacterium]